MYETSTKKPTIEQSVHVLDMNQEVNNNFKLMANRFTPSQQHEGTVDLWSVSTKLGSATP
jgi:hypothetical protein